MKSFYAKLFNRRQTPQQQPVPVKDQVRNAAGGYTFALDKWGRLERFLILGSDTPTYYASGQQLTLDNAESVYECAVEDGRRTVDAIVAVSRAGRAPRNDAALFALALVAKLAPDVDARRYAFDHLDSVARIGTHLFTFAANVDALGGWGRGTRRAFGRWYAEKSPADLAYQAVKYQQRDGWSHRDVLRLAHPQKMGLVPTEGHNAVINWIVNGWESVGDAAPDDDALRRIWAFERAQRVTDPSEMVRLIRAYGLTREMVPTEMLRDRDVWAALLETMPLTAMIRSLSKMTQVGLLAPLSDHSRLVVDRLGDEAYLRRARVHPLSLLVALNTYRRGRGVRGSLTWEPVGRIVDSLDEAFYLAFGWVRPTGKRVMLALDVSGSMAAGEIAGMTGVSPRIGSAAMAMVTARTERDWLITGFTGKGGTVGYFAPENAIEALPISPSQRLDDVVRAVSGLPFGRTDCALPMLYALEHKLPIDAFVIYTDNETWAGNVHPFQALRDYRERMGIDAKLIVVGMTATRFTIADPSDAGMLDVVGFDTAAPNVIGDFIRGA